MDEFSIDAPPRHLLNAKEIATLFPISARTIYKHAKAGKVPHYRIGTSVRFDPTDVENWVRGRPQYRKRKMISLPAEK